MAGLGLAAIVVVLLLLRQNVFVILGTVTAISYVAFADGNPAWIFVDAWEAANKEILLSIPLYILAGNLMARGAIAARLIRVAKAISAPVPAGLAISTVLSCAIFAAVSGSGTVALLAIGSIMYPALVENGYPRSFALGVLCAGGTLGIIIPPSIPLILYGVMTQTSITDLFLAGIGPGLLLIGLLSLYSGVRYGKLRSGTWDFREILAALRSGIWSLFMPVLILGGIYSGHFTPTESAAVAVVYAIVVELFIHREMGRRDFHEVVTDTARLLGALFPVLMMALSLNVFLTYEQVPESMVVVLSDWFDGRASFLVASGIFLLLIGCIVDIGSAILILAPLLHPLAVAQGVDPVHFGILMTMNLEIGYLTPPLGLNLIVAMMVFRVDFGTVCRAVLPFMGLMLLALVLVAAWAPLSLFPVR